VPSDSFRHSAIANVPIDVVWAALDNPETWESIGGIDRVVDPVIDELGRLVSFSFDTEVAGKAYRGSAIGIGREEGRRIGWRIENSEITGTIGVALTPNGQTTEVGVDLSVSSRGLLSGMFFSVISKTIGSGLPLSVDEFAAGFG
jgi:carbon monoxide dehydrogenase subunit G